MSDVVSLLCMPHQSTASSESVTQNATTEWVPPEAPITPVGVVIRSYADVIVAVCVVVVVIIVVFVIIVFFVLHKRRYEVVVY